MADVTIFHHTGCSTSRHAVEAAAAAGTDVEVAPYLKTPLDRDQLLALLAKLEDEPAALVRKDSFFRDQGLVAEDFVSPEEVADLLVQHPRLMERPVLVRGDRAIIGRPKDRVAPFLAG
ncbi:putative arsenate reductase [Aeromicrobium marinum DSM 15272]|uniref:Arsenate reductase n=1 Tax=Aeromicrobium marinum DSM 15272 TaxID=585531 RepID=E2SD38_9ACTN|nr:ArsC/Spx/MgsR family protein [Aeromicrobium marinum]EFQ83141.1 putative arsenate reductase [Aeromicrobium marinum DSM 15272]